MDNKRVWVRFGGSHAQYRRHMRALLDRFGEGYDGGFVEVGAATLGSRARCGTIPDTPESRQWVHDTPGITIQRR